MWVLRKYGGSYFVSKIGLYYQGSYRKICSKFTNAKTWHDACYMVQKSDMKACNSSAHPVKGHNLYCSRWSTHFQSKLIGNM